VAILGLLLLLFIANKKRPQLHMSCGLVVGPSQTLLFGEPEAGLIPLNFGLCIDGHSPKMGSSFLEQS